MSIGVKNRRARSTREGESSEWGNPRKKNDQRSTLGDPGARCSGVIAAADLQNGLQDGANDVADVLLVAFEGGEGG